MRSILSLSVAAAFALAGALASPLSAAPIGTGWVETFPDSNIQIEAHDVITSYSGSSTQLDNAGGHYTNSGGIETFSMTDTTSNRVERRYHDEYVDARQFEADVMFTSPTNNESIHQCFNGTTGPWLIVRQEAASGGSIKVSLDGGGGSGTIATNLTGVWFHLTSINNPASGTTQIYVNGTLKWTGTPPGGTFYTKYGCYGTLGAASASVQFKNVHLYKKSQYSGNFKIVDKNSGKAVVVQGASLANSAPCVLYTYNGTHNDEWTAIELADGHYEFKNVLSGKAMVVQGASTANSAPVIQYDFGGSSSNDEWDIHDLGTGYYEITNVNSGLCLAVHSAGTTNGTIIDQYTYKGDPNQQFQLISVP